MEANKLRFTPFIALFTREVRRFFKIIFQSIATPLISTTLYLLIFGVSIGRDIQIGEGVSYLLFLIPGLMMMTTLRNTLENAMGSIVVMRFCGELEELRIAPITPTQIVWGNGLGALLRGLIVGLLTLLVGLIFYYLMHGTLFEVKHPMLALFFLIVGGLAFAHLGLIMSMFASSFEQVNAINVFILLPMIYLGGVFFSLEQLHPFWQTLSQFNPLLYFVNGMRYSILGVSDVNIYLATGVLVASMVILNLFAIFSLKRGSYQRW